MGKRKNLMKERKKKSFSLKAYLSRNYLLLSVEIIDEPMEAT